ncbi:MAG TPA: CPBP family intramembrane glutamic endopeptidase [Chloroflexota bacterium]|nr:CPBP family intramembrane glutamic endopeptidase [Chloroflexota bacterium]
MLIVPFARSDNPLFTLANSGRRQTPPLLAVVVAVAVGGLGAVVGAGVALPLLLVAPPAVAQPLALGAVFLPIYLLLGAWLAWVEGRPFATLGFTGAGVVRKLAVGAMLGAGMFAAVVALQATMGAIVADPQREGAGPTALGAVLAMLVGYGVQGPAEEVLFRGWLLPTLGARTRPWVGIVGSAALFALFHGLNPGLSALALVNLALVGVFLALWALAEGSLWGVSAWHALWNWTQGAVFGLSVSGWSEGPSLLALSTTGPAPLSGGRFGPEASLATTAVLGLGIALLLLAGRYRPAAAHGR